MAPGAPPPTTPPALSAPPIWDLLPAWRAADRAARRASRRVEFAAFMDTYMGTYEAAVAGRKGPLFRRAFAVAAATGGGASVASALAEGGEEEAAAAAEEPEASPAGGGGGGPTSDPVRVLDVGIGVAPNVEYYPPGALVTGVDPNPAMHPRAVANTHRRRPDIHLTLLPTVAAAAAAAAAATGSPFDVAVCTLTLCSVGDPADLVAAAAATLRPGGVFVFVEHVAAQVGDAALAGGVVEAVRRRAAQVLAAPQHRVLADGCRLTQDAEAAVRRGAEWTAVEAERFWLEEAGMPLLSPHVAGMAVKG